MGPARWLVSKVEGVLSHAVTGHRKIKDQLSWFCWCIRTGCWTAGRRRWCWCWSAGSSRWCSPSRLWLAGASTYPSQLVSGKCTDASDWLWPVPTRVSWYQASQNCLNLFKTIFTHKALKSVFYALFHSNLIQSWARNNFLASRQRQRDNATM